MKVHVVKLFLVFAALVLVMAPCIVYAKDGPAWKSEIAAITGSVTFDYGVYIQQGDAPDGFFEQNATKRFPSASIIKLFILQHLFEKDGGTGELLNKTLTLDRSRAVPGGILHQASNGAAMRLEDIALLMLAVSDNTATNLLIDELGMDAINATIQRLGAKDTILGRKMLDSAARKAGRDNFTTAADTALVLKEIAKNPRMLQMLSIQKNIAMLPALLPIDDPDDIEPVLAHKTGELDGLRHDAGVFFYDSKPVVAVVLTSGLPTPKTGQDFGAAIGKVVYDTFLPRK